jgi:hypothetical protein
MTTGAFVRLAKVRGAGTLASARKAWGHANLASGASFLCRGGK